MTDSVRTDLQDGLLTYYLEQAKYDRPIKSAETSRAWKDYLHKKITWEELLERLNYLEEDGGRTETDAGTSREP